VADTSGLERRRRAIVQEVKGVMLAAIGEERPASAVETAQSEKLLAEYESIVRQLRDGFDGYPDSA
jgi:hypothetical protein